MTRMNFIYLRYIVFSVVGVSLVCYVLYATRENLIVDENRSSSRIPIRKSQATKLESINWDEIFSFDPIDYVGGCHDCEQIFEGKPMESEFIAKLKRFDEESAPMKKGHGVEGYSATSMKKYQAFVTLVKPSFIHTVCEIGFNAGHSAFGWLASNPDIKVYSFDIGSHKYARPISKLLQKMYPNRLSVTWGDSTKTLPQFHEQHPDVKCDFILIDGGHVGDVPKLDLDNFRKMASEVNIVIVDDYPHVNPGRFSTGLPWEHAKRFGIVSELFHCTVKTSGLGGYAFTVGRYLF